MVRPKIKPRVKPRVRPSIQRWIAAVFLGELLAMSGAIAQTATAQTANTRATATRATATRTTTDQTAAAQTFTAAKPNNLGSKSPVMASPLGLRSDLRNTASPCAWIMRQGGSINLTQICGNGATTPPEVRLNPNAILPNPFAPRQGLRQGFASGDQLSSADTAQLVELPSYGVIFIDPVPSRPVTPIALTGRVGNATSAIVQDVRILYDIINPGDESPEGVLVQAQKSIDITTLEPGQQSTFTLTLQDIEQALPGSLADSLAQSIPKLALRITQVTWTEADQTTGLASPQSVRYAQGMGRCHFPWEKGGLCQGIAISERFYRPIDGSTYASADRAPSDRIPDTIPLLRAE
jgi:hypothetical protein